METEVPTGHLCALMISVYILLNRHNNDDFIHQEGLGSEITFQSESGSAETTTARSIKAKTKLESEQRPFSCFKNVRVGECSGFSFSSLFSLFVFGLVGGRVDRPPSGELRPSTLRDRARAAQHVQRSTDWRCGLSTAFPEQLFRVTVKETLFLHRRGSLELLVNLLASFSGCFLLLSWFLDRLMFSRKPVHRKPFTCSENLFLIPV